MSRQGGHIATGRDGRLPGDACRTSVQVMHIAYRAETLIDAHLVKDALERAEIPAFVAGEYLTGGVGQLPAMDYVAVMVPESTREAAAAVVEQVQRALAEARREADRWDEDPGIATVPA